MNAKLLMVSALTLLYKESLLTHKSENSAELVRTASNMVKLPEAHEFDRSRDVLVGLRSTLMWMADQPIDHSYDPNELLQRIKIICSEDTVTYDSLSAAILLPAISQEELQKTVLSYRNIIKSFFNSEKVKQIIKQAFNRSHFEEDSVNYNHLSRELVELLEPYSNPLSETRHPAIVDDIDMGAVGGIKESLSKAVTGLSSKGGFRSGWHGLNRMLGDAGVFRRGEFVLIGALQHQFKTGLMLNLFRHAAMFNEPSLIDETRKPLLLFFSYENEVKDNILQIYISMMENETGLKVDIDNIDYDAAEAYVIKNLTKNGFHVRMLRIDPSDWTYHDLFNLLLDFEAQGYEIVGLWIDYLNMQSKEGCASRSAGNGSEIRELIRRVRNFTSKRGTTVFTPHQLSTEAKNLVKLGIEDFVKEIANKGYYDSCRTIDQEVDLEIYIHKEIRGLDEYLSFQRGKHRKPVITPVKDLYFVMKFHPIAALPDDIHGVDVSRRRIGAREQGAGGGDEWYVTQSG